MNVNPIELSNQQTHNDAVFPLALECLSDVTLDETAEWITSQSDALTQQAFEHGAVLLRGFPLRTAEDFDRFVSAFGYDNFAYKESLSNAVRINKTERVFTANEAPPDVNIFMHHEMAQTPVYPSKLLFFCEHPADEGGQTPLCRSDVLWQRIVESLPEFAHKCESEGLKYSNVMPGEDDPESGMGRSWQSTFGVETKEAAEARMQTLGYSWEWLPNDELRATTPKLEAVRLLSDGRKSFFNQLIAAFNGWKDKRNDPAKAITFGDSSPMDAAAVNQASDIADELAFGVPWQQGDVALVDNFVTMHGRWPFKGTRKVLASLVACAQ